jgi:hypothetical protein
MWHAKSILVIASDHSAVSCAGLPSLPKLAAQGDGQSVFEWLSASTQALAEFPSDRGDLATSKWMSP